LLEAPGFVVTVFPRGVVRVVGVVLDRLVPDDFGVVDFGVVRVGAAVAGGVEGTSLSCGC